MLLAALLQLAVTQADASAIVDEADAGMISPPTASCPKPVEYPLTERASGIGGASTLRVLLSATGSVTNVDITTSLGPAFDRSVRAFVASCTFTGAQVNGVGATSFVDLSLTFVPPARPWTLQGHVVGELGQPLAGATVSFGGRTMQTSDTGWFTMTFDNVPPGDEWVSVHKEGFALKAFPEPFRPGQTTEVRYVLPVEKTFETLVTGSRLLPSVPDIDKSPQVSRWAITAADIDRTPGALEDIARVVQSQPGVAADPDLLAEFFVRGGGPDEVLFQIDGVPLTNPYHLGGFASIMNPLMIDSAEFFSGGFPARYEPSLSGVLDVKYATGETKKFRVSADVSMATAKARVDIPLGIDGLSAVVSFRRSYFELYFAILKAFKVFGQDVVAPDITEGTARVFFHRGRHRTMLTFIHASDGLNFVINPGEEVFVNFAGGLKIENTSQIISLRHSINLGGDSELSFTGAFTRDINRVNVESTRRFANDALHFDGLLRSDLKLVHSARNRSGFGLQYVRRSLTLTGEITDTRTVAPWSQRPIVESFLPYVDVTPQVIRNVLSAYAEHTWLPHSRVSIEGGGRLQFDVTSLQWTGSARLAAAVTLPSATVLKLSGGFSYQPVLRALQVDPVFGNPSLLPERSVQVIGGVEQALPFNALLRVEAWGKWLGNLAVNPDTEAGLATRLAQGLPAFTSDGFGRAWGVDALMVARTKHFWWSLGLGTLSSERTNPLATIVQTYSVQWEQRFTAAGTVSWSPNARWIVTARANVRTGRPYTPVIGFREDLANRRYVPIFGATNAATYPVYFELNLRGEYRFTVAALSCAVYVELLNTTNTQNVFQYLYSSGDFNAGTEPTRGAFNHLPIRPFIGVRGQY